LKNEIRPGAVAGRRTSLIGDQAGRIGDDGGITAMRAARPTLSEPVPVITPV
jgi:hypothetical protein